LDSSLLKKLPKKYCLFAFGTNVVTVDHEIEILCLLAEKFAEILPEISIVARTYPNSYEKSVDYSSLEKYKNIMLFDTQKYEYKMNFDEINNNKFTLINKSMGVINIGTTMGLEAAILNKPVIQIGFLPGRAKKFTDAKNYFSLDKILENDHLKNYVLNYKFEAVVRNEAELDQVIRHLKEGGKKLIEYSVYLKRLVDPNPDKPSIIKFIECL
jgi:hypothetical protein